MATSKAVNLVLVFINIFSFLSFIVFSATVERLPLPSPGPETTTFDPSGEGPYTGLINGRIVKYNRSTNEFDFFAVNAPNRSEELCNDKVDSLLASTCGRPLGMAFYNVTKQLFVADASLGLFLIEPSGGQGILLANSANGTKFKCTGGLDVDQTTGNIYFTDESSNGGINELPQLVASGDSSGRVLKYNQDTNEATTLLSGLGAPDGLAVSQDGSYILFTEFTKKRIQKYWLKGPQANTLETILNINENPSGVKRTRSGEFWVPAIANQEFRGLRIDGFGNVLETLTFDKELGSGVITDIQEYGDALLIGSLIGPYLEVYRR